jgi:hypothetical protein
MANIFRKILFKDYQNHALDMLDVSCIEKTSSFQKKITDGVSTTKKTSYYIHENDFVAKVICKQTKTQQNNNNNTDNDYLLYIRYKKTAEPGDVTKNTVNIPFAKYFYNKVRAEYHNRQIEHYLQHCKRKQKM